MVMGVLTVLGVYLVGVLIHGRRLGEWAAVILALDPRYVTHAIYPMSENAFVPATIFALATLIWVLKQPTWWKAVLAGVLLGLSMLTRSVTLYFTLPAALILAGWGPRRWGENSRYAVLFILGALSVVTPWTIRNYRHYQRFVPIALDDGARFVRGNLNTGEDLHEYFRQVRQEVKEAMGPDCPKPALEVEANQTLRRRGLEFILQRQPLWVLEKIMEVGPDLVAPGGYMLRRGGEDPDVVGEWGRSVLPWVFALTHVVVLVLAPLGLSRKTQTPGDVVLILFLLFLLATHLITHLAVIRLQLQYNWILILYAARALVDKPPWTRQRVVTAFISMFLTLHFLAVNGARALEARQEDSVKQLRKSEREDVQENRDARRLRRQTPGEDAAENP